MKPCNKCGVAKPLDGFYAQPGNRDGRAGKCKDCVKRGVRTNYRANKAHYQAYEQSRAKDPERKKKAIVYQRHRRQNDGGRSNARTNVLRAVRARRLVPQPCEVCGSPEVQAHHEDYTRPLDVMWLCFEHHRAKHGQQAEATEGVRSFKVRARGENSNSKKEAA